VDAPPTLGHFGLKGSRHLSFGGGAAYDFDDATDISLNVGWSVFLLDDVEWELELDGWYFAQKGDDAVGINPVMYFRWHFWNEHRWSFYADLGIGVLAASDNVPPGGTGFDFTPRASFGVTHVLNDDGLRLDVGVRWHHISNARIQGEERNPGHDAAMIYAGLVFPLP
jgi:hypothetical protein